MSELDVQAPDELTSPEIRPRWSLSRADVVAMAILVAVPAILFTIPAVLGHPALSGDNLIQNYPLRELTGKVVAAGHVPLWNPLAFSGTPLLGSLNAGSLYPLTGLFVVLPGLVAWVLNLIVCYVAAGVGLFALCRWLGLGSLPAFLGALTYAFMGAMVGQLVHLGVIQGQGWLPWVVLALLVSADRIRGPQAPESLVEGLRAARWALVGLVALTAVILLTGEPRAISDLVVVGVIVTIYGATAMTGRAGLAPRAVVLAGVGVAVAWGAIIAAAQVLPGQDFIALSQRSDLTPWFIGSGSLKVSWTTLMAIPDLLGGTGLLHQPSFFVEYNLPEVTGYAGMLGLVALFASTTQLFGRARRLVPRWVGLFVVMTVIALVLAWGSYTPLFHVIIHIPIINRTRLQSRNLAIVDLAVAVLVAWFVDRLLASDFARASLQGWRRWVTASPLIATIALAAVVLVAPGPLLRWLGARNGIEVEGHYLWPWIVVSLVLALAALSLLLCWRRLSSSRRSGALVGFMVIDMAFFLLACTVGLVSGHNAVEPSRSVAAATLGTHGRFALIDPSLSSYEQFIALGQPNTNVFTGLPSVQGYGSLVGESYGVATGTHVQGGLDACQLKLGRYRQLQLATMVIGAPQLAPEIYSTTPAGGAFKVAPPVPECPGAPVIASQGVRRFYFGRDLEVRSVFFAARSAAVMRQLSSTAGLGVSVLGPDGQAHPAAATVVPLTTGWSVTFSTPTHAAGLVITGPVHQVMSGSAVTDATGSVFWLGGIFQDAVDQASWRLTSTDGSIQTFTTTVPVVASWSIEHGGAGSAVLSTKRSIDGSQTGVIHLASPSTLVRSEAYLPGWKASYVSTEGGPAATATVTAHDLVQSVALPAGEWRVTFVYVAPGWRLGAALSTGGIVVMSGLVAIFLVSDRRRRRSGAQEE